MQPPSARDGVPAGLQVQVVSVDDQGSDPGALGRIGVEALQRSPGRHGEEAGRLEVAVRGADDPAPGRPVGRGDAEAQQVSNSGSGAARAAPRPRNGTEASPIRQTSAMLRPSTPGSALRRLPG